MQMDIQFKSDSKGSDAGKWWIITYTHSDNSVYAVNTSKVQNRWHHIAVVRESGSR